MRSNDTFKSQRQVEGEGVKGHAKRRMKHAALTFHILCFRQSVGFKKNPIKKQTTATVVAVPTTAHSLSGNGRCSLHVNTQLPPPTLPLFLSLLLSLRSDAHACALPPTPAAAAEVDYRRTGEGTGETGWTGFPRW